MVCAVLEGVLEGGEAGDFVNSGNADIYMLFTSREVRIGKNCARGLGYRPRP